MKKITIFYLIIFITVFSVKVFSQSDEYGIRGYNSYLTGLGLALSYVNVANGNNFNNDSTGGIECWINLTATSANPKTIISKGVVGRETFLFGVSVSNKLFFRIGTTEYTNTNGTTIPLNQWSHVAVSWREEPNYIVKFYVNGLQSGDSVVLSSNWPLINSDPLRIGGSQYYTNWVFPGNIDEVRYYNKAINPSAIACNRFVGLSDVTLTSPADLTSSTFYKNLSSSWTFNQAGTTANDYVGGNNGSYVGSATQQGPFYGHPLPYNFALKLSGEAYNYIRIADNAIFDQSTDGSFEFWYKPLSFSTEQIIISKGASVSTLSFILGISVGGKLYMGLGPYVALNSSGSSLDLNTWNHITITWNTVGTNFEIKFYKNGKQNGTSSTIVKNFTANSDVTYIGSSQIYNLPAKGFLDELRLWNTAITPDIINTYMFVSGNSFSNSNLLLRYGFDGTLNNSTSTTGVNGSFNNGYANNKTRFSGYSNDTTGGNFGTGYIAHTTVINRNVTPNPFPASFYMNSPFRTIPDNNITGITDSIVNNTVFGTISGVEIFLSIDHPYVGDLKVQLIAPNNTGVYALSQNGGAGKNILTFFNDNFSGTVTGTTYLPPWGFVKPFASFVNFIGMPSNGTWKLNVSDVAASDIGVLKGWGLKFDYITSTGNENENNPKEFKLFQNFPNPFNAISKIKYQIAKTKIKNKKVQLIIYNSLGQEIEVLVNKIQEPGVYEVTFNGSNYASGVYFYKLIAVDFTETKKLVLMK